MNIIFLDFDGVLIPYDSNDGKDYFGAKFTLNALTISAKLLGLQMQE